MPFAVMVMFAVMVKPLELLASERGLDRFCFTPAQYFDTHFVTFRSVGEHVKQSARARYRISIESDDDIAGNESRGSGGTLLLDADNQQAKLLLPSEAYILGKVGGLASHAEVGAFYVAMLSDGFGDGEGFCGGDGQKAPTAHDVYADEVPVDIDKWPPRETREMGDIGPDYVFQRRPVSTDVRPTGNVHDSKTRLNPVV